MFEIYKFEYDCGFITKETLKSYVPDCDLSQDEYNRIVGEDYVAPQAQPAQAQPAKPSVPQV
ncbi:XkdX family protein [Lactobacillus helveticus]|nr:XkdX family protein [Lactobacillus helveticus]MCT0164371.1 XkdX family protein [Lactobacillus helveticus]